MVEKILALMEAEGLRAVDLVEYAGLPKNAISEWKSGKAKPSIDALIKIADYFRVSVDYFLGRTDDTTFTTSNISNSAVAQGHNSKAVNGAVELSKDETDLLRIYASLDFQRRVQILSLAAKLEAEIGLDDKSE